MKKFIILEVIMFVLLLILLYQFDAIKICIAYLAMCKMGGSISKIVKIEKRLENENR